MFQTENLLAKEFKELQGRDFLHELFNNCFQVDFGYENVPMDTRFVSFWPE